MAWNEPGSNNSDNGDKDKDKDKKDPWSGKPKPNNPPDLEALLRDWRKKLMGFWQKKSSTPGGSPKLPLDKLNNHLMLAIVAGLTIVLWLVSGLFVVGSNEQAVILRFGQYAETADPGVHWILWPFESAARINIEKNYSYTYSTEMLTQDRNLVAATVNVNYRINNARNYLFNLDNPNESLRQVTATALAQTIGKLALNQAFAASREQIAQQVRSQLIQVLATYQSGITLVSVTVSSIKAPDAIKDAYDDVLKAQADVQQSENQAQLFAKQIEPTAQGQVQKLLTEAKTYQQQIVLRARTDTEQFLALLPQYEKAPQVTRELLYLQTLETILANHPRFVLDAAGDNTVIKLPANSQAETVTSTKPSVAPTTNTQTTNTNAASSPETRTNSTSSTAGDYP